MSWKKVTLGEVCDFQNGFAFKSNLFTEEGFPILRISNIQNQTIDTNNLAYFKIENYKEKLEKYIVEPNDLLIAMSGATTGKIGFNNTNQRFYLNQRVGNLKPKQNLNKKYLYYFLSTQVEKNLRISAGAAQPNLSTEQIKEMLLPLPPLATQQKIVAKLDAIFAEIDKATAVAGNNAKNAENLYSSSVNSVFEEFSSDFIKLSTCSDIGYGYTAKSSDDFEGYQYLRITDIQNDYVDWLSVPKIDKKNGDAKKFLLKDGDIVFARTGATTGKSYLVRNPPSAVFASYLIRVDVKRNMIEPEFLRHFFKSKRYWDSINAGISGAAQGGFNASKLSELAIPLLNLKDQSKVIARLDEIENYSSTLKIIQFNKLNELLTLKQSVLRHAFNGELVNE